MKTIVIYCSHDEMVKLYKKLIRLEYTYLQHFNFEPEQDAWNRSNFRLTFKSERMMEDKRLKKILITYLL